jgi:hypothetical protein
MKPVSRGLTTRCALDELLVLSSQIRAAVLLDPEGRVLAAAGDTGQASNLARAALDVTQAAGTLSAGDKTVTRVEVEVDEGALFVLSEAGRTIAATTGPKPSAGLVVYDLRTCLRSIAAEAGGEPSETAP